MPGVSELNQLLRRFLQYKDEAEWIATVLDGCAPFAAETALFGLSGQNLRLLGARGIPIEAGSRMAVDEGSAFENAVGSGDIVVALRTPREVSRSLASEDPRGRAYLCPISNGLRVAAVLFAAEGPEGEAQGIELVCGMASVVLQRQANAGTGVKIAPAAESLGKLAPVRAESLGKLASGERKTAPFADLSDKDLSVHLMARRWARAKVAEIQLAHPDAARAGREQNDVYLFLKKQIDGARETYRKQFGERLKGTDYLHEELVQVMADGDERRLGEEYPGYPE